MTTSNWVQHTLKQAQWRPTRQVLAVGTLFLFVAIIIGGLYLSQSSSTAQVGRQLEELLIERNTLEQANEQLRAEIASLRGLERLQVRAQALGFQGASESDIEYIVVDGYHPERETVVEQPLQVAEPVPAYDESFVGWLEAQFATFGSQLEASTAPSANQQETP